MCKVQPACFTTPSTNPTICMYTDTHLQAYGRGGSKRRQDTTRTIGQGGTGNHQQCGEAKRGTYHQDLVLSRHLDTKQTAMVELEESIPPGLGTQQVLLLLGVFNGEATGAHYDPVTVSVHQGLVGDALGGPGSPLPSAMHTHMVRDVSMMAGLFWVTRLKQVMVAEWSRVGYRWCTAHSEVIVSEVKWVLR